jgi:hypothetical protein
MGRHADRPNMPAPQHATRHTSHVRQRWPGLDARGARMLFSLVPYVPRSRRIMVSGPISRHHLHRHPTQPPPPPATRPATPDHTTQTSERREASDLHSWHRGTRSGTRRHPSASPSARPFLRLQSFFQLSRRSFTENGCCGVSSENISLAAFPPVLRRSCPQSLTFACVAGRRVPALNCGVSRGVCVAGYRTADHGRARRRRSPTRNAPAACWARRAAGEGRGRTAVCRTSWSSLSPFGMRAAGRDVLALAQSGLTPP